MKRGSLSNTWPGGVIAGILLLFFPADAAAHLVTTGMGPVYDGIGHLLLTPEDLVPAAALALYAGLRGCISGRRTAFLLPLAWLAGGIAGTAVNGIPAPPVAIATFMLIGLLVAADLRLPAAAVTALAIGIGLVHGFFNGAALKDSGGTLSLIGIAASLFVLVALTSALVVTLERPSVRIAVRVVGSWVFASGLLMLGWVVRG